MKPAPVIDSYARRSRKTRKGERRDRDLSTLGQHAVNLKRIQEHGGVLGKQLTEIGRSAWQPGVERPQFDVSVNRLQSGAAGGVCIYDIDRMLRRVADALRLVEIAEQGFVILDADGEYDLMTPNGREQFYRQAIAAEAYSFKLSTKVKRGLDTKAQVGEGKPGRYRPLGFEPDATTVNEAEREPIRRAVRKVLETRRWQDAADILNHAGILTSAGHLWQRQTVHNALLHPRMAGHIVRRDQIVARFPGQPILEETMWQEMLAMVQSRSPGRPPSPDFMCTRRVRCGNCGSTIGGKRRDSKAQYQCKRRFNNSKGGASGCGKIIADRDALDLAVGELVIARLSDPRHASQVAEASKRRLETLLPHEKELGRLIDLRTYWDQQLLTGACDQVRHSQMVSALKNLIDAEEQKIVTAGVSQPVAVEVSAAEALAQWARSSTDERRALFDRAFTGFGVFVDPGPAGDTDFTGRIHVTPLLPELHAPADA